jgi:hypothetical protein
MEDVRTARIYRLLHGAPMLAGIPAHYVLILMGIGTVFGLGGMIVSKLVGLLVVAGVGAAWMVLALVYGQDRTRVPVLLLQLRYRFCRHVTSFCPQYLRVRLEE